MNHPIVVDLFAGGGGASTGIELAGLGVDVAVNHSEAAILVHEINHPHTKHYHADVWTVDPVKACGGRPVGFLWASPDCTHFSRAKGGKPRSSKRRALAGVVLRWVRKVRPSVIALENVPEFEDWGPLLPDGSPCQLRKRQYFERWVRSLRALGYAVEWRSLVAADYGAPTTRKRLYLLARCDGLPIVWPAATHGKDRTQPWRPASEIIDWSLPCPSIFGRKKPLAEATLRRIAAGVQRFVVDNPHPFIVPSGAGLVAPALVQTGYGERKGQAPRALDIGKPLGTVVAGGGRHALVAAFLTKHYGGVVGHGLDRSLGTVTTIDHHALTTAFLVKYYGTGGQAQSVSDSLHTVTTRARFGLVMVHGQPYSIQDIGMRMLSPRELFNAQGFPSTYDIGEGRVTKTQQIALAGNSVCPPVAAALVRANVRAALSFGLAA